MPLTSQAQARYMFANHPRIAKEFASKTKSIKSLPEKKSGLKSKQKSKTNMFGGKRESSC